MQTTDHTGKCGNHTKEYGIYVDHSEKTFEKRELFRYLFRVANYH